MKNTPFSLIAVFNDPQSSYTGNTSTVVFLDNPIADDEMQHYAAEFNQPATTYLWRGEGENQYHVRWFAPDSEIGLCGHGSLAAIAFLTEKFDIRSDVKLVYRDGYLSGKKSEGNLCTLTLDAIPIVSEAAPNELLQQALGVPVIAQFKTGNKDIVLTVSEKDVQFMKPDFAMLRQMDTFGYAVTAPGDQVDFVSRTLVPHVQQLEDPATGSSHAALVPFWSKKLNKQKMIAHQLSKRGGKFICELDANKVSLSGSFKVIADGKLS